MWSRFSDTHNSHHNHSWILNEHIVDSNGLTKAGNSISISLQVMRQVKVHCMFNSLQFYDKLSRHTLGSQLLNRWTHPDSSKQKLTITTSEVPHFRSSSFYLDIRLVLREIRHCINATFSFVAWIGKVFIFHRPNTDIKTWKSAKKSPP